MANSRKAPKRSKTKKRPPRPETITVEVDSIHAGTARAIRAALADADRVGLGAVAVRDVVGELASGDEPDRVHLVAAQLRAVATDVLHGALALSVAAERLEAWAEVRELGG